MLGLVDESEGTKMMQTSSSSNAATDVSFYFSADDEAFLAAPMFSPSNYGMSGTEGLSGWCSTLQTTSGVDHDGNGEDCGDENLLSSSVNIDGLDQDFFAVVSDVTALADDSSLFGDLMREDFSDGSSAMGSGGEEVGGGGGGSVTHSSSLSASSSSSSFSSSSPSYYLPSDKYDYNKATAGSPKTIAATRTTVLSPALGENKAVDILPFKKSSSLLHKSSSTKKRKRPEAGPPSSSLSSTASSSSPCPSLSSVTSKEEGSGGGATGGSMTPAVAAGARAHPSGGGSGQPSNKKSGSAQKHILSPRDVEYLRSWMMSPEHVKHPYPTREEKERILAETGVPSVRQLDVWFVNNRKRYWRKMVGERGVAEAVAAAGVMAAGDGGAGVGGGVVGKNMISPFHTQKNGAPSSSVPSPTQKKSGGGQGQQQQLWQTLPSRADSHLGGGTSDDSALVPSPLQPPCLPELGGVSGATMMMEKNLGPVRIRGGSPEGMIPLELPPSSLSILEGGSLRVKKEEEEEDGEGGISPVSRKRTRIILRVPRPNLRPLLFPERAFGITETTLNKDATSFVKFTPSNNNNIKDTAGAAATKRYMAHADVVEGREKEKHKEGWMRHAPSRRLVSRLFSRQRAKDWGMPGRDRDDLRGLQPCLDVAPSEGIFPIAVMSDGIPPSPGKCLAGNVLILVPQLVEEASVGGMGDAAGDGTQKLETVLDPYPRLISRPLGVFEGSNADNFVYRERCDGGPPGPQPLAEGLMAEVPPLIPFPFDSTVLEPTEDFVEAEGRREGYEKARLLSSNYGGVHDLVLSQRTIFSPAGVVHEDCTNVDTGVVLAETSSLLTAHHPTLIVSRDDDGDAPSTDDRVSVEGWIANISSPRLPSLALSPLSKYETFDNKPPKKGGEIALADFKGETGAGGSDTVRKGVATVAAVAMSAVKSKVEARAESMLGATAAAVVSDYSRKGQKVPTEKTAVALSSSHVLLGPAFLKARVGGLRQCPRRSKLKLVRVGRSRFLTQMPPLLPPRRKNNTLAQVGTAAVPIFLKDEKKKGQVEMSAAHLPIVDNGRDPEPTIGSSDMELPLKCARADEALSTGAEEGKRSDNAEEDEGGKHKNAHGMSLSSDIGPDDVLSTGRPFHPSRHVGNARFVVIVFVKIFVY